MLYMVVHAASNVTSRGDTSNNSARRAYYRRQVRKKKRGTSAVNTPPNREPKDTRGTPA